MATETRIVGMMLVRGEQWCIRHTLPVALLWCDRVCVAIHHTGTSDDDAFVDTVQSIARLHEGRVDISVWHEHPAWSEMTMRNALLEIAQRDNPTHVAIIDGDEALTEPMVSVVREIAHEHCRTPGTALSLPMVSPYHSLDTRRIDGSYMPTGGVTVLVRCHPTLRYANAEDGYCYHARPPRGSTPCSYPASRYARFGGMVHFQFASRRRLIAKAVWYKLVETLKFPGRMSARELNAKYDWTLSDADAELVPMDERHVRAFPTWQSIQLDDHEPWQEREARRMLREHGFTAFRGIALYGIEP